jgi:transcriptional regulator with XRE-family HTH domain
MSADGVTQTEIARDTGLSQPTISRMLREGQEQMAANAELVTARRLSRGSGLPSIPAPERDVLGRILCTEEDCEQPASAGSAVCEEHGGPAARVALADLINPAIRRLGELIHSQDERVALAASEAVLNRTGYAKAVEVTVTDAREVLMSRLLQARQEYLEGHPEVVEGEVISDDIL